MATIKSYTDLDQSKKLAKILPLESADMHYSKDFDGSWFIDLAAYTSVKIPKYVDKVEEHLLPCWSLAALLDVLPKEINALGTIYSINIYTKNEKWFIDYKCNNEEFVGTYSNIFLDACYEMIIKLHELKLL